MLFSNKLEQFRSACLSRSQSQFKTSFCGILEIITMSHVWGRRQTRWRRRATEAERKPFIGIGRGYQPPCVPAATGRLNINRQRGIVRDAGRWREIGNWSRWMKWTMKPGSTRAKTALNNEITLSKRERVRLRFTTAPVRQSFGKYPPSSICQAKPSSRRPAGIIAGETSRVGITCEDTAPRRSITTARDPITVHEQLNISTQRHILMKKSSKSNKFTFLSFARC